MHPVPWWDGEARADRGSLSHPQTQLPHRVARLVVGSRGPPFGHFRTLAGRIGPLAFENADYDADGDMLYLHVEPPTEAEASRAPSVSLGSP